MHVWIQLTSFAIPCSLILSLEIPIFLHLSSQEHILFTWQKSVKVQIKLTCCVTKDHVMKNVCESGGIGAYILHFSTRLRWVISFTPSSRIPRVAALNTHCVRRWVDTLEMKIKWCSWSVAGICGGGEQRYSSTHSHPQHYMWVSGHLNGLAPLPTGGRWEVGRSHVDFILSDSLNLY
jgi:hypothetical protein